VHQLQFFRVGGRTWSSENLAAAIQQAVTDTGMQQRAATLGAKLRTEEGIGMAADLIEQYAVG
jgi:sterol 3beta-glucosyltransferase